MVVCHKFVGCKRMLITNLPLAFTIRSKQKSEVKMQEPDLIVRNNIICVPNSGLEDKESYCIKSPMLVTQIFFV